MECRYRYTQTSKKTTRVWCVMGVASSDWTMDGREGGRERERERARGRERVGEWVSARVGETVFDCLQREKEHTVC